MKKTLKLISAIAIIGVVAITNVATTALASEGEEQEGKFRQPHPMMEEIKEAVDNGDYDAFQALIEETGKTPPMLENINADNFYLLGEMHQARQNGDMETAKEIADQLGFEKPNKGMQRGQFKQRMQNIDPEKRDAMKVAVESGDYDAWYTLITEDGKTPPVLESINADNFHLLSEMHQAKQDGDMETTKEIADQLGFEKPNKGMQRGMHKGERQQ